MTNFSCLFTILNFSCFYITFQPSAVCLHFSSNFSCNFLTNFRDFCPHIEKSLISLPCTVAHLSTNMPDNFLDASSNVFLPLRTLPDDLICDRLSSIFCCCSLGKMPKGNSEMGIILLDPNAGPPLLTYHKLTTNVSEIKKVSLLLAQKVFSSLRPFQRPTAAQKTGDTAEVQFGLLFRIGVCQRTQCNVLCQKLLF